ncbi:MAG: aminotransferase, partial [Chelatococcus sp.]
NVSVSKPNSTLLDASARNLPTVLRVSPHYYNSEDEIDLFVDALNDIVASG